MSCFLRWTKIVETAGFWQTFLVIIIVPRTIDITAKINRSFLLVSGVSAFLLVRRTVFNKHSICVLSGLRSLLSETRISFLTTSLQLQKVISNFLLWISQLKFLLRCVASRKTVQTQQAHFVKARAMWSRDSRHHVTLSAKVPKAAAQQQ